MNTVTEAATLLLKDDNILDTMVAAESSHLSPEAVVVQKALVQAMKAVCCVYKEAF